LTSCLDRYGNEIRRVLGVIDAHLKKTGKSYLVGDKCTYADLAFVPWHWLLLSPPQIMGEGFAKEWQESYPKCWEWSERLLERDAVKKCREDRTKAIQASKK
jgi:glutathione S-transferase